MKPYNLFNLLHNSNLVLVYLEDKCNIVNEFSDVEEVVQTDSE